MTINPVPDAILHGCRSGNLQAQQQLFERYNASLFGVCLRYACDRPEAQDILQEAFLVIFRDIRQFNGVGSLEGWLRKVTIRTALQHLRRRNPLRFAEDYTALSPQTFNILPDTDFQQEHILQMVQELPPGYRCIFNLRCLEDFSYAEIATELGIAESSARSQYTRACQLLRKRLELLSIREFRDVS
jgi:RNA polymerase sigma-70 factor (ECF subfamily)